MGLQFPVTESMGQYVVDIPEEHIPLVRPVEIPEKVMITVNTYVYGGGGLTKVDDVIIPRTGLYGRTPIPISPKLTHYRKKGARRWIYIPEEPVIYPGYWRAGFFRASIPKAIRVKYRIFPDMECQIVYTERVPAWLVTVYHLGNEYNARWYPRIHVVRWVIDPDNLCYHAIETAFNNNIACSCECHIERDLIYADIIFSGFGGKIVAEKLERCYRYQVVRNFNLEDEIGEYPVNAELRVSYLTTCFREYYQSEPNFERLIDALDITMQNLQAWFLFSFHKSLKPKGDIAPVIETFKKNIMFGQRELFKRDSFKNPIESMGRMKVTRGYTEPQELHPSTVKRFPYYRCILYCRIDLPRWKHEYSSQEIKSKLISRLKKLEKDKKIPEGLIYFDIEGFLWKKQ